MRGAKRVYFDKDQDDVLMSPEEQFKEPMPLRQASMNHIAMPPRDDNMMKPPMLPRISQQNFAPTRVNIDLEDNFHIEDKENFHQNHPAMVRDKENLYRHIQRFSFDTKAKPRDPRKGTILQMKNKSSRLFL